MIEGIANVGGLAGTQMPERVLSDSYEKGGKQMIGKFPSEDILSLGFNFECSSELYQESECPFGDSLMVMGEGFSQVDFANH